MALIIMALDTESCYAECHLCLVSRMLSVADKPFKLSVLMLSVFTPSVVGPLVEPEPTRVEHFKMLSRGLDYWPYN